MSQEQNETRSGRRSRRSMGVGAAAVVVALGTVGTAAWGFDDVPANHPFYEDIQWMSDTGISTGFDDGTFRPSQPVTRQSMAAFMRRLAGADPAVDPVVDAATLDGQTLDDVEPMWAMIDLDGTIVRQSGDVVSAVSFGTGGYQVVFDRDVTPCGYSAMLGDPDYSAMPGDASAAWRLDNANALWVTTYNAAGTALERPFTITVNC